MSTALRKTVIVSKAEMIQTMKWLKYVDMRSKKVTHNTLIGLAVFANIR